MTETTNVNATSAWVKQVDATSDAVAFISCISYNAIEVWIGTTVPVVGDKGHVLQRYEGIGRGQLGAGDMYIRGANGNTGEATLSLGAT